MKNPEKKGNKPHQEVGVPAYGPQCVYRVRHPLAKKGHALPQQDVADLKRAYPGITSLYAAQAPRSDSLVGKTPDLPYPGRAKPLPVGSGVEVWIVTMAVFSRIT